MPVDMWIPWILLALVLGLLLWGAWPRAVGSETGRGADESSLAGPVRLASAARVATFNIHGGRGRDGRREPARAASDLEEVDIAALQEVHDSWRAPRQLAGLATKLGMAALNAPTRRRWFRSHRANALLTRFPVGTWRRLRLPGHPKQRFHFRNLTVAQVHLREPLWVLFTHLNQGEGGGDQLEQALQEFRKYSPAVLMGDLNMNRRHPVLRAHLASDEMVDALGRTLADDDPERVDWILCRGVTVKRGGRIDSGASDHPLYWCDIEL